MWLRIPDNWLFLFTRIVIFSFSIEYHQFCWLKKGNLHTTLFHFFFGPGAPQVQRGCTFFHLFFYIEDVQPQVHRVHCKKHFFRGCSSVGRALLLHSRCQRFESAHLHQWLTIWKYCALFYSVYIKSSNSPVPQMHVLHLRCCAMHLRWSHPFYYVPVHLRCKARMHLRCKEQRSELSGPKKR